MWLTGPAALRHVGSSPTRARTRVPCISRQILNHCATREAQNGFLDPVFSHSRQHLAAQTSPDLVASTFLSACVASSQPRNALKLLFQVNPLLSRVCCNYRPISLSTSPKRSLCFFSLHGGLTATPITWFSIKVGSCDPSRPHPGENLSLTEISKHPLLGTSTSPGTVDGQGKYQGYRGAYIFSSLV